MEYQLMRVPPFAGMRQMSDGPTTDAPKERATAGALAAMDFTLATIGASAGAPARVQDLG